MRAVLMREFGGPEVLELAEIARPRRRQSCERVEILAIAVSHEDNGRPGIHKGRAQGHAGASSSTHNHTIGLREFLAARVMRTSIEDPDLPSEKLRDVGHGNCVVTRSEDEQPNCGLHNLDEGFNAFGKDHGSRRVLGKCGFRFLLQPADQRSIEKVVNNAAVSANGQPFARQGCGTNQVRDYGRPSFSTCFAQNVENRIRGRAQPFKEHMNHPLAAQPKAC